MSKRVKISSNFYLDEYIPELLYKRLEKHTQVMIGLIDDRLIRADQILRHKFGPVTINNWWNGGPRTWSGLRLPESPVYSPNSQHTFGRASDKIFRDVSAEEVRKYIEQDWKYLGITCIEANVNWVHSDIRNTQMNELLIVYP